MSASHLPQDDSISLRDIEAGGSTLESGSSGFSVSDGFAANIAKLPELVHNPPTMAHSMYRFAILALASPLPIRPSCSRSSSRPTMTSRARKAVPGWGLPYRSGSSRCTADGFGSSRNLAEARLLRSRCRSSLSGRLRPHELATPAADCCSA